MNNIYKVIWSKAKNCYVVASEIAKSHTKSASGSEKIGGVTRRKLLASLMALSLICGGLGVASAADGTVHVEDNASSSTSKEVYTTDKVDALLAEYGRKSDVENNKNSITTMNTTITKQGQSIATNVANIANNKEAIEKKIDKETANERFATKVDLTALQNQVTGKADKTYVDTEVGKKANKATTLAGYDIKDAYTKDATDTAITTKVNEEKAARELKDTELSGRINTLSTTVDSKVSETDLNTTLRNYYTQAETNAAIKTAVDVEKNARDTAIKGEVTERNKTISDAIAQEVTNRDAAITKAKTELQDKVTAEETARKEEDAKLEGKITENSTAINNEKTAREAADTDLSKRIGTVTNDGEYIKKSATNNVSENLTVLDTRAKTNANNIKNNKDEIARVNGELVKTNNHFNTELRKTNDYFNTELGKTNDYFNTELRKTNAALQEEGKVRANADAEINKKIGSIDDTRTQYVKEGQTISQNLTKLDNELKDTNDRTGGIARNAEKTQTTIEGKVTVDNSGNVDGVKNLSAETIETAGNATIGGALNVTGESNLKNTTVDGTLTAKGEATFKDKVTMEKDLEVKGELKTDKITMEHKETKADGTRYDSSTTITADSITHFGEVEKSGVITKSQFTHTEEGSETYAKKGDATDWTETRSDVKADGVKTEVKDSKENRTNTSQTAKGINGSVTDKDGNTTYTKVTATENSFQVQDKDGKNKNHQVNTKDSSVTEITNAAGATTKTEQTAENITNTAEQGTITSKAKDIVNDASGNISNKSQTMDTTVTGKATESYGELETTVNGKETHNVTGTKTENVTGKVTENYNGGQETNVTGNQDIHVTKNQTNKIDGDQVNIIGGSQTTTATDINRNASSGMIDTIDNDYGTNTETKVAGKTTTDVSIKGTGEEGKYIRGANESRDYLIKGTLKNSETKTAEATSSEITDGTNTASTRQDAKNLAGFVTNGTETGISGIHANDDGSVSIDSAVAGGGMSSVINQKKDSITSAVGDGTNSTVILQDKDNVTIASSNGTVAIGGKDIVNNAQDTITNTAGTKITDTAGDSTVTTENGKGTTFTKTGSTAYREGGPTDTNISGNTITTGKVTMDYAEVMKDLGVHGNATVDKDMTVKGNTTLGEAGKDTTLTVNSKATFKEIATFEKGAEVRNGLTVSSGESTFNDKVTMKNGLDVTGGVASDSFTVKGTDIKIDSSGINAGGTVISNVADGSISEGSKDAVNGGQLYQVKNDLEGKVNKVGANAAAMANLHPMEFDPDSKWNIAAAMGSYGSETATAIGAFYRPNEDVMVNFSTAFGTGENMVGGGVSVRLGKGSNKLSREESNALKSQVDDLTARMDALLSVLNPNMSKDFPDVPENHWAYEAVSRLAGNDIVQGYPDGEFHGERTMTRYEMAEIIYNALSRGAEAERELVEEFKPELQAMAASEKATAERAEG